jgi:hypothetical protein
MRLVFFSGLFRFHGCFRSACNRFAIVRRMGPAAVQGARRVHPILVVPVFLKDRAHAGTNPEVGNSFAVVREMRVVPLATGDVLRLLVATVIPMVPLLLTIIPLDQLVTEAIKFVF